MLLQLGAVAEFQNVKPTRPQPKPAEIIKSAEVIMPIECFQAGLIGISFNQWLE